MFEKRRDLKSGNWRSFRLIDFHYWYIFDIKCNVLKFSLIFFMEIFLTELWTIHAYNGYIFILQLSLYLRNTNQYCNNQFQHIFILIVWVTVAFGYILSNWGGFSVTFGAFWWVTYMLAFCWPILPTVNGQHMLTKIKNVSWHILWHFWHCTFQLIPSKWPATCVEHITSYDEEFFWMSSYDQYFFTFLWNNLPTFSGYFYRFQNPSRASRK